jgi:hypothetical protein
MYGWPLAFIDSITIIHFMGLVLFAFGLGLQAFPIVAEYIPVIIGNGNIHPTARIGGSYANIGIDETAIDETAPIRPMKACDRAIDPVSAATKAAMSDFAGGSR